MYECWWTICRDIISFGFEYDIYYVLYQFVTYLLTLPRIMKRDGNVEMLILIHGRSRTKMARSGKAA
jgi:hypothetical protein